MKNVYVVIGYMNSTGSVSLMFPEDIDIVGFYENKEEGEQHVSRLNEENSVPEEDDDCADYDGMVYELWDVKNLKNG